MLQNLISLGILYGLVSMVGWGSGDFVAAKLSRRIGNFRGLFWVMAVSLVWLFLYVFISQPTVEFSARVILFAVIAGLLHTVGGLSFYKGLDVGKVSLVAVIASSWSIILVLFALLFQGEQLTLLQTFAVFLVIAGNIVVSTNIKELLTTSKVMLTDPGIPYGFGALFGWGVGWIFFNEAIGSGSWLVPNIVLNLSVVLFLLLYGFIARLPMAAPEKTVELKYAIFVGTVSVIAYIAYSIGIENYMTSIVAPVSAAYSIVTVFLARVFLKERFNGTQLFGMLAIIVGVVLLSV